MFSRLHKKQKKQPQSTGVEFCICLAGWGGGLRFSFGFFFSPGTCPVAFCTELVGFCAGLGVDGVLHAASAVS